MQFFVFLLFFFINSFGHACTVSKPTSSIEFSENFKIGCIQWLSSERGELIRHFETPKKYSENEFTRENYPVSGVYDLEKRKLLWGIKDDGLGYCNPLNDGHHAFFIQDGFVLMKDGHIIKSLVREKDFCKEVLSNFCGLDWYYDFKINDKKKEISFKACNELNTVDLQTGGITKTAYFDYTKFRKIFLNPLFEFYLFSILVIPLHVYRFVKKVIFNKDVWQNRIFKFALWFFSAFLVFYYLLDKYSWIFFK